MKKIYLLFILLFAFSQVMVGQTTLSAGDIAIFGVNADNPDDFGFVLLVDIESGTVIYFTDSGWKSDNTFRGNEGAQKYTAPSALPKGTEITFSGNSANFVAANDANVGTNGLNLSGSGDQVFAYQGSSASPTFIYAVQTNSNVWQADATGSTNSAIPQGLTNGTNAVAVGSGSGSGDEYDNAAYDKSTMTGSGAELLAEISNNANWGGNNSTRFDMTTFDFTVSAPLPVELTSFTAASTGSAIVVLNWTTATEVNNYGFEIEASTSSATGWENVGFVEGHGNSNSPKEYSYIDNSGATSYRLKQVDTDGGFEYSDVVTVAGNSVNKLNQNYPNPFNPTTQISFSIAKVSNVNISVYNALGQKVAEVLNQNMNAGNHTVNFNGSNLASGFYFYRLETPNYTKTMKMMLIK